MIVGMIKATDNLTALCRRTRQMRPDSCHALLVTYYYVYGEGKWSNELEELEGANFSLPLHHYKFQSEIFLAELLWGREEECESETFLPSSGFPSRTKAGCISYLLPTSLTQRSFSFQLPQFSSQAEMLSCVKMRTPLDFLNGSN